MSALPTLETAIGLCFIFMLGAIFASAAVEWFANIVKKRAKDLLVGLRELIEPGPEGGKSGLPAALASAAGLGKQRELYELALNPGDDAPTSLTVQGILNHALIQPLKTPGVTGGKRRNPSYIPSDVIAKVVLDQLLPATDGARPATLQAVVSGVNGLSNSEVKSALLALAKSADGELDNFRKGVQKWYEAQMDRVTGAYKRWAKKCSIVVALAVVAILHLDAIAITTDLWTDESVRSSVVAAAIDSDRCQTGSDSDKAKCVQNQIAALRSDGLPIGPAQWSSLPTDVAGWWIWKLLGLAISVAAISMGAPFWFDLMNKLINVRNAGTRPPPSTSES